MLQEEQHSLSDSHPETGHQWSDLQRLYRFKYGSSLVLGSHVPISLRPVIRTVAADVMAGLPRWFR